MHRLESDLRDVERTRTLQRQSRARGRHRELALVGYTNAGKSTLLNQLTGAGVPAQNRLFVTLDPRTRQLQLPGGETVLVTDTVGFVRKLPHELVEAFRSTLDSVHLADLVVHVVDGTAANAEGQMAAVHEVLAGDRRGRRARTGRRSTRRMRRPTRPRRWPTPTRARCSSPPGPARASTSCCASWPTACAARTGWWSWWCPGRAGDVLAAIHREGEVVAQRDGEESATLQVVLDDVGRARFAEFVSSMTFRLPPYPYDRLDGLAKLAEAHPGGMVDCSIGTPYDPPLPAVVEALAPRGPSAAIRHRPAARAAPGGGGLAGSPFRHRRASGRPRSPPASGTKELVASVPHVPAPAPTRPRHRAVPRHLLPDLCDGRRAGRVPRRGRAGRHRVAPAASTSRRSTREDAARALVLWSNSPSNPTGGLGDLGAEAAWGRHAGVPVFSDECYAEFTWDGPPRSILEHGTDGVVAVHSLSKRSNLAGVRVGFYAGDAELVEFLRAVRQHAGLMVPGPAQAAGVAALADDEHVVRQRERYLERLRLPGRGADGLRLPDVAARGRVLSVGARAGRALGRRLGHGRGAGP